METMAKIGNREPIIYKDPETGVAVGVKVIGGAEVYTTGVKESETRDVIERNVNEAAILGMVKFLDEMSRNSVGFNDILAQQAVGVKLIANAIKNAGYGVEKVIIARIFCDKESEEAMERARNGGAAPVQQAPAASVQTQGGAIPIQAGPKFCPNCGAPANGAKFCGNCGTKLI